MSHGLPDAPPGPPVDRSLDHLAPGFARRVKLLLADMATAGHEAVIAESRRSNERQAWLYGFGREWDDGRGIVTQAPTGVHSWHSFGLAVDIISAVHGWEAPASFWHALGEAARHRGLSWGGDWPRFRDRPHVQMGAPMRQAPSTRAAELWAQGPEVLWREVQAL